MLKESLENRLAKFLSSGLFLTSIAVFTAGLTDPVNVPKFLLLGLFAIGGIGFVLQSRFGSWYFSQKLVLALLVIFAAFSLLASLNSKSPLVQNLYGSYGRNNGLLTYLFLSIVFFIGTFIIARKNHLIFLKSLIMVGLVNLGYGLWVICFGDFIPWNNVYGNILGTFGNPNFIGAFFGIFFGVLLALGLGGESSKRFRYSLIVLLPLTLFEIFDSHAIQGRVLAALSLAVVGFFYIRFRFKQIYTFGYIALCTVLGILAVAGTLQIGPLTGTLYKTSVSLRGQYWLAAWNTGQANPVFGSGMDSFGDWYRRARDLRAIELPGVNTIVNTAHNVPLDMFAFGGWPLFIAYLAVMGLALKSLIRIAFKLQKYDAAAIGLITAWICYQAQSIISINQIGLAIWGWALSGLLIGYERLLFPGESKTLTSSGKAKIKGSSNSGIDPKILLTVSALALIGFLIALPPVSADNQLRNAQVSRDSFKVEETMVSGYFNPQNTQKYEQNIQAFESSALYELSHKYALEAVEWNPEAFELWRLLYFIKNSTPEERALAESRMKSLDPLNPDVTPTQ